MSTVIPKHVITIDGHTESVWKSVVVKSLRIGWPEGIRRAEYRIGKSAIKGALTVGLFEDVFPATSELMEAFNEIRSGDYDALCRRQTHHGRKGLTAGFFALREEACALADGFGSYKIDNLMHDYGIWMPPRGRNVFWTWHKMQPSDAGQVRTLDPADWAGIPSVMIDGHTYEGKAQRKGCTLLSGHYEQHVVISELVLTKGWDFVRAETHKHNIPVRGHEKQDTLF